MTGEVAPEETVPFVVTLKTSVHASFYSVDLVCKVGASHRGKWVGCISQPWGERGSETPRQPERQDPAIGTVGGIAQAQIKP